MRFRSLYLLAAALSVVCMSSFPTQAQTDDVQLIAKPGLCILQDAAVSTCLVAVELSWSANSRDNYCLHHSTGPEPLACWNAEQQGQHIAQLVSRNNVSYWLQRSRSRKQLAPVTVRVLSLAQRQPNRRRRRHAWTWL